MTDTATIAEPAAAAIDQLARLTRPAITTLDAADMATLTEALTRLAAGLSQTLSQLSNYLNATDDARASLQHAATVAGHLVTALNTAHHDLGNTAETPDSKPEGVNFRPTKRGQISTAVDIWTIKSSNAESLTVARAVALMSSESTTRSP